MEKRPNEKKNPAIQPLDEEDLDKVGGGWGWTNDDDDEESPRRPGIICEVPTVEPALQIEKVKSNFI